MSHKFLSEVGVERLSEVAAWLEAGAPHSGGVEEFNMDVGVHHTDCGTACCIAGAVCQFFDPFPEGPEGLERRWLSSTGSEGVANRATRLLGIPDDLEGRGKAEELFRSVSNNDFITPKIAAKALRHFIATGEVVYEQL